MTDDAFQELLRRGRTLRAGEISAVAEGFEGRLALRLAAEDEVTAGQLVWRSAAGCAALVALLAAWFLVLRTPAQAEDDLTAYWWAGQAVLVEELN